MEQENLMKYEEISEEELRRQLETIEVGVKEKLDVSKYIGQKSVIESYTLRKFKYSPAVIVKTAVLAGTENIRASKLLPVFYDENRGKILYEKGEATHEFLMKYNVTNFKDLIGQEVTLQTDSAGKYLTFI